MRLCAHPKLHWSNIYRSSYFPNRSLRERERSYAHLLKISFLSCDSLSLVRPFRMNLLSFVQRRLMVETSWNVMAHAQKRDFVFRRNGRIHLNRRGASVQSTTGSRGVRISGSNAGYTMFRGSVKSTGYPLHSPVSPSFLLPCVTVCHHISTGLYVIML